MNRKRSLTQTGQIHPRRASPPEADKLEISNHKYDEFVKSRIHQVFSVSYLVFGVK